MNKKDLTQLTSEDLFSAVQQLLQDGYDVEFTVTGNSMWPLLAHRRDSVTLGKAESQQLKKGDIVLLQTKSGYLLHRITGLKKGLLQTTGDHNCYRDDYVQIQSVLGRVVSFQRKGKQVSCSDPLYRCSSWLWRVLYPVRPLLLRFLPLLRRKTL